MPRAHYHDLIRLGKADLSTAMAEPRSDVDRLALTEALRSYHQDLGTWNQQTEQMLQKLEHPNSRVVVTGQQAGLLSGPAYSVHKAVDAVLLARQLNAQPPSQPSSQPSSHELEHAEQPVQAIYWIASQDHDAEEVAATTLLDMEERIHHLHLKLPKGVPIGRIAWREEWTEEVKWLLEGFRAPESHKKEVSALLDKAMQPKATQAPSYADVFARIMHGLLANAGLLVLDPLHPALAKLMQPTLERELHDPLRSSACIEEAAVQLEQLGLKAQLRRSAGATNLFFEHNGQRQLLRVDVSEVGEPDANAPIHDNMHGKSSVAYNFYTDQGDRFTRDELLQHLQNDPSCLTPAAGLRPVVQDALLPTVAFVVGPGELAYGSQLREVYPLHGLQQPLLWPRLRVTWLEPNVSRLLDRFDTDAASIQADAATVLGRALARERGANALSQTHLEQLQQQFRVLHAELGALDPTLEGAVTRSEQQTLRRLAHLQQQAARALAHAENTRNAQLKRLQKHLLPREQPQERQMNFLTYALKHGLRHAKAPLSQLLDLPAGFQGELRIK